MEMNNMYYMNTYCPLTGDSHAIVMCSARPTGPPKRAHCSLWLASSGFGLSVETSMSKSRSLLWTSIFKRKTDFQLRIKHESMRRPRLVLSGVPIDLFGEISLLFKYLSCWHFHRTEQIKYCISNISYFTGILYE